MATKLVVGQTRPTDLQLVQGRARRPIPLDDVTEVLLRMQQVGGAREIVLVCTRLSPYRLGKIRLPWTNQLDTAGVFKGEFRLTYATGEQEIVPGGPAYDFIVRANLA